MAWFCHCPPFEGLSLGPLCEQDFLSFFVCRDVSAPVSAECAASLNRGALADPIEPSDDVRHIACLLILAVPHTYPTP